MAAVGTYTVRWVERINKGRRFDNKEWRAMQGLMKTVAQGARGIMRVYTRACCDKSRKGGTLARGYIRELELRQLSIGEFVGQTTKSDDPSKENRKKTNRTTPVERKCAPPTDILTEFERGGVGLVRWAR